MHDDLAELAADLARLDKGRPKQASLRRSVSTAYYALFHALCDNCVSALIGWNKPWSVTTPIYRLLDHGVAKQVFSRLRSIGNADVRRIADAFLDLHDARRRADYDPGARFGREQALDFAARAAAAIRIIRALPADTRLDLAVQLISKQR